MSDSENKSQLNIYTIYIFICSSLIIVFLLREILIFRPFNLIMDIVITLFTAGAYLISMMLNGRVDWSFLLQCFAITLFILWFNKYMSRKIKNLFGFEFSNGVFTETRKIDEPGVYNVFSDMITAISNAFLYVATFKFLKSKDDTSDDN